MMAGRPATRDQLLDAAEDAVRTRGYHGVSFRELADDVGIKSASVHYYFAQKENLGVALVERYSQKFFSVLQQRFESATTPAQRLAVFCDVYRASLGKKGHACLCGMLGAESSGLPEPVTNAVADFFQRNLHWLDDILSTDIPKAERHSQAVEILATLQGGMMLAMSLNDPSLLDAVIKRVMVSHTHA